MTKSNPYETPTADGIRGVCTSVAEVEYDFAVEDSRWFVINENSKHVQGVRTMQVLLSAFAVALALTGLSAAQLPSTFFMVTIPTFGGACFLAWRAIRYRTVLNRRLEKQWDRMLAARSSHGIFGRCLARIDEQGVYLEQPSGYTFLKWWAVPEITSKNGYLVIYHSAAQASLIPARAFTTDGHFEAFAANAERLWQENKSVPLAETV